LTIEESCRHFDFRLSAASEADGSDTAPPFIKPGKADATPIYLLDQPLNTTLAGAIVCPEYGAKNFASGSASVEVVPPTGEHIVAQFDLGELR
jgi:hypothetical protein